MSRRPSPAFRRWCAGLIVLVFSWSMPAALEASVSPVEVVKFQLKKPNFVLVVESSESMQGLPGENPARYNEVGADCEKGDRFCRLYGQKGRCEFSGMGSKHDFDGEQVYSGTLTSSNTTTKTETSTETETASGTKFITDVFTSTSPNTSGETATREKTETYTESETDSEYPTVTNTKSETAYQTTTISAEETSYRTETVTGTEEYYKTGYKVGTDTRYKTATVTGTETYYPPGSIAITHQVFHDQSGYGQAWGGPTISSSSNRVLLVFTLEFGGKWNGELGVKDVKYNNATPTWLGSAQAYANDNQIGRIDAWIFYESQLPAGGSYIITATPSYRGYGGSYMAISLSGVSQSELGKKAVSDVKWTTSVTATSSVGPAKGDMLVDSIYMYRETVGTISHGQDGLVECSGCADSNWAMRFSWDRLASDTSDNTVVWNHQYTISAAGLFLVHFRPAPSTTTATRTANTTNTGFTTVTEQFTKITTDTELTTETASRTVSTTFTDTTTEIVTKSVSTTDTKTLTTTETRVSDETITELATYTQSVSVSQSATHTISEIYVPGSLTESYTDNTTSTESAEHTRYKTETAITTYIVEPPPDPNTCINDGSSYYDCKGPSYCYLRRDVGCSSDADCTMAGDFCQKIVAGKSPSSRMTGDFCVVDDPPQNCRYQDKTCSSHADCGGALGSGPDYCVPGIPAKMCSKSGLWCRDDDTECEVGELCDDATSRMMMVKNAVRRVILEHAYDGAVAKFGHMHTYQTDRSGNTVNLFPYVKLQEPTVARTETRFLTRAELLRGNCFSESDGPSESCTIDYSAGGATTTPSVSYSLVQSGANSRYAIPTGDGKTFSHEEASWAKWDDTCVTSYASNKTSPVCRGQYEGSFYTFTYQWGMPIDAGDSNNPTLGSRSNPKYEETYKGKSYGTYDNTWMLIDAERSDFVNDNKYGATAYSGAVWSSSAQYPPPAPLLGSDWNLNDSTCSSWNGGQWDYKVVPRVDDSVFGGKTMTPAKKGLLNAARFEKASFGGFHAVGSISPVGCMLKNEAANDSTHSVDGYVSAVKGADGSACWQTHVLMVVDGLPRGPGDLATGTVDCAAAACMYSSGNQELTGCNCPAVTKARSLAKDRGVNVHVIAATNNLASVNTYAAATLNNIARAGSTTLGFMNQPRYAASEDELYFWLNYEMKEALRLRVATTPAAAANSSQSMAGITAGNMLYQTVADLPEWRGSVIGYSIGTVSMTSTSTETSTSTSTEVAYTTSQQWDAARANGWVPCDPTTSGCNQPDDNRWKHRNVYFSDKTGVVRKIEVGTLGNVDGTILGYLSDLGMGSDTAETQRIVEWMLGKLDPTTADNNPRPLNPAVMGSVVNSMPISVGPPGMSSLPGGNHFYYTQAASPRPELVYVGADDGMLHAFDAGTGEEKFAFIPADMVPVITRLYAQGGQRYNPDEHIYGLAGSPKVKNLCWKNCQENPECSDEQGVSYDTNICPEWKTVLIMPEGKGGNHPFALDITQPIVDGEPSLTTDSLLWHVGYKNADNLPTSKLGDTLSVPAFAYLHDENRLDQRVLMASSYPASGNTTYLLDAKLTDGDASSGAGLTMQSSAGCSQTFGMVADVALARDYSLDGEQSLIAAYMADTHGTIHQYAPAFTTPPGTVMALGCSHPLYFSPAVIQLNRVDSNNINGTSVFLAQVTNSLLDPETRDSSEPSMLVIKKLTSIGNSPPAADSSFGDSGEIKLKAGSSCTGTNCLCGKTESIKHGVDSGCGTGGSTIPDKARPTGSPLAVLRSDGQGFQVFTTWYLPPAANWDNCTNSDSNGTSYITVHEFLANGTWAQIVGLTLTRQYVTGVQFVGTTLFVTYGTNEQAPGSPEGWNNFGQTFNSDDKTLQSRVGDRFILTAWSERLDQ